MTGKLQKNNAHKLKITSSMILIICSVMSASCKQPVNTKTEQIISIMLEVIFSLCALFFCSLPVIK
ncbi:MAG: hypothetical protein ACYSXD_10220, partial [Planctomycetota bacterium]